MSKVSLTLWSVMRIPIPLFARDAIICFISSTEIGSTPAKGSSRRINFGSLARALAISTRRLSPPDKDAPRFLSHFLI